MFHHFYAFFLSLISVATMLLFFGLGAYVLEALRKRGNGRYSLKFELKIGAFLAAMLLLNVALGNSILLTVAGFICGALLQLGIVILGRRMNPSAR